MKKTKLLIPLFALIAAGCITSKAPDGSTSKQVDKAAVAQAVDIAVTILHDPVVSNAVWQATQKK